jgi:26S proteasome regulatory subunit N9
VAGIQGEDTALAAVYLRLEVIFYHLRRAASTADRVALEQQCKQALDECREQLRHYAHAIDPVVHSQLYRAALEFHRVFGSANEFFHNAILFLSYTPLEQLSHDEQARLAAEVVEAALVGDRVYNFGELLQHPILEVLRGSPLRWLADLLTAFNTGDMKAYMAITAQMPPSPQRDLMVRHAGFLNQKIRVMALMEAVFNRIDLDRTLTFAEISSICEVPLNEVERLLLKAFALKVVRGSVDEVEKRVRISWVQPRVLSREQVAQLGARVSGWAKKVHDTAHLMQTQFQ